MKSLFDQGIMIKIGLMGRSGCTPGSTKKRQELLLVNAWIKLGFLRAQLKQAPGIGFPGSEDDLKQVSHRDGIENHGS